MDLQRIGELGFEKISIWYMFVLVLSFSFLWNVFVSVLCFIVYLLTTSQFAFGLKIPYIRYILWIADICYVIDVVFTLSYYRNKRLKKLKFAKCRHWVFILIDIVSLIPIELLCTFHYVDENKNPVVVGILMQNKSFRVYRIFLLEWFYMSTVQKTWKYIFCAFLLFFFKILTMAHVFTCIWYNVEKGFNCDKQKFNCFLWYEVNMMNVLLLSWSGPEKMFTEKIEKIILTCAMFVGYLMIFTYMYPYTLYFSILSGCRDSIVIEKRRRLNKFMKNMIISPNLRQKVLHYFKYLWSEGEEDLDLIKVIKHIPLSLQKEIFTDIYWEAYRHSDLLRGTSRSFKRSLSLLMKTKFHHDGELIYHKGQEKRKMIYLVQGNIQLMAEENKNSPLLSFSSGTVFGEMSLFLLTTSQAFVQCKGHCEIQTVSYTDILKAMKDYPKDRKIIFDKFHERMGLAKHTQWRKKKFKEDQKLEVMSVEASYFAVVDCVKWLKMQWRNSWEGHKRYRDVLQAKAQGTRLSSWRMPVRPEIKIEFISNYLDLVVLSNILEERKDVVCLETKFPWFFNPNTQFLVFWKYVILVTSLLPALAYPVSTGWCDRFPVPLYLISYIVTLIYMLDIGFKLTTAVETKHTTITNFSQVAYHNLKKITFYLDIIAAFPYHVIILRKFDIQKDEAYKIGLPLHPAIVKSYVFFRIGAPLGSYVDVITILKNCMIYFLLIYWLAEIIQLISVRNIFDTNNSWMDRFLKKQNNDEFLRKYLVSTFKSLVVAISVPSTTIYPDCNLDLVVSCFIRYFFFVFSCFFMGSYYTSLVVKRFGLEKFRILMRRLNNFLISKNIPEEIGSRIVKSIRFQWVYDKGDYITSDKSIPNSMPYNIRKQVYLETIYNTLESNPLFKGEKEEFLLEVLEMSDCVAVPPGLVVVTYGHISHLLTVINRGHCQLNSHLENDVTANLGRPVILGPSSAFPLLSSFCCVPSPISVVTITDCELIVIELNQLIGLMLKYNIFQDIVTVMKESQLPVKLRACRPALMKICALERSDENLSYDLKGRIIFTKSFYKIIRGTIFRAWGYFYMVYLIVDCFLWPSCFGLLIFQSHIIIPFLFFAKIIALFDMLMHVFLPYYNKQGLMISHPLHTFLNYLNTSFVWDVIRVLPVFPVYFYAFSDPQLKPRFDMVLVSFLQRSVSLVYIAGCIEHLGRLYHETYYTALAKVTITIALIINMHVNICMFQFSIWTFDGPRKVSSFEVLSYFKPFEKVILRNNNVGDYYLYVSYWIINTLTTNRYYIQLPTGMTLYLCYVHCFIGTIACYYLYVTVSSASKFANLEGAAFREEYFSLMRYLNYEKTEEKTVEIVRSYYTHLWSKTGGENIKELFGQLPFYLLEELWYPLYRPTFVKNNLFEKANEGFFRILSTHVSSVFFTRGSLVIFKKETQSYIYFLHRGKCFVYDWLVVLDIGSIVGDLHQTGIMMNKVYALTHVEMLKISSKDFFSIINNFDILEANFLHALSKAESFIKSDVFRDYQPIRPVDSRDAINAFELRKKEIGFEDESQFEDPQNVITETFKEVKYKPKEKYSYIIYPYSWFMKVHTAVAFINVLLTILAIPMFWMFGGLSIPAFIVFAILDFIWLIQIILSFFVGMLDKEKGDVITNHKIIAKNYLKNAFALDVLGLIPFELVPLVFSKSVEGANVDAVLFLRLTRYSRLYSFYKFRVLEFGMVKSESLKECIFIGILFIWTVVALTAMFVRVTDNKDIVDARDDLEFKKEQFEAALSALLYVVNIFTSANVPCAVPDSRAEMAHFNFGAVIMLCLTGKLMCNILSLIYYRNLPDFNYKARVTKLRIFLQKREASPILVKSAVNYETNLFRFSRSENMPKLLLKMPSSIRISLMCDLFNHHIINFPLFAGLDWIFLKQLIARAKREVYFPGEMILEQGDVDHKLYFIHTGEVYVINPTKEKAYTEYVVGKMHAGEYFGEAQGLWFKKPHIYTYRGRTVVEIIALHSDDWMDLRKSFPEVTQKIFEKALSLRYI